MGHSASAYIHYGVVIGDSEGGWNFKEGDNGYGLPAPWDGESENDYNDTGYFDSEVLEELLDEFLGVRGKDYSERAKAYKPAHIEIDSGGYEYSTQIVKVKGCGLRVWDYGTKQFGELEPPSEEQARQLVEFIQFLESKNLVLDEESRNPGWLLVASYG